LGVIAYQMLCGAKPYVGDRREDILAQHSDAPVPKLPLEHAHYQPLIDRLLAKTAAQRLASAREVIEIADRLRSTAPALDYVLSATSA
jgi:serine/threonine-protein kinase PpkA